MNLDGKATKTKYALGSWKLDVTRPIWGCVEKGSCRVPRHKPSVTYPLKRQPVTYPLSRSLHVFRSTKIFGYVAKTSLCYIPYVTGYVTGVGQGPCYKPIVLARANIWTSRLLEDICFWLTDPCEDTTLQRDLGGSHCMLPEVNCDRS